MSVRIRVWTIGLLATGSLSMALGLKAPYPEVGITLALLGLAVCALVAEILAFRSLSRRPDRPTLPDGARPADGVVDVVPVLGIDGEPHPDRPAFRRFTGLSEPESGPFATAGLEPVNPNLLGRAVLVSVFVGLDGKGWTDPEIARSLDSLERAGLWIEREAIRRGAPVNVGLADAYFRVEDDSVDPVEIAYALEGDKIGPMEARASIKAVVGATRAAARLGFGDAADLLARINARVDADARVWLFHLRRSGRSLAIPASESDLPGVGLALCYSREASFPERLVGPGRVDPTTLVHEVLHLFGASDKYGVPLRSFPSGSVTSRDVMRLNHDSLDRMTIDPLTASEIGWPASAAPT